MKNLGGSGLNPLKLRLKGMVESWRVELLTLRIANATLYQLSYDPIYLVN